MKEENEVNGEVVHTWTCSSNERRCRCQLKTVTRSVEPEAVEGEIPPERRTWVCGHIYGQHNHQQAGDLLPAYDKRGLTEWEMAQALEMSQRAGGMAPAQIAAALQLDRAQLRERGSKIVTNKMVQNALFVRCPNDVGPPLKHIPNNTAKKTAALLHVKARSLKKLQPRSMNTQLNDSVKPNGSPQRASLFRNNAVLAEQVLGVNRVSDGVWLPMASLATMQRTAEGIQKTTSHADMSTSIDRTEWCLTIASDWGLDMVAAMKEHAWWGIPSASVDWTPDAAGGNVHLINFALRGLDGRAYFPVVALCSNQTTWVCDAFKASIAKLVTSHTGKTFNLRNWYIAQDNAGAISASARHGEQYQIDDYWHMKKVIVGTLPRAPRMMNYDEEIDR